MLGRRLTSTYIGSFKVLCTKKNQLIYVYKYVLVNVYKYVCGIINSL